jgi:hypothetical protein
LRFKICFDVDIFEFENDFDILALEGIGRIFWIKIADLGYKRPGRTVYHFNVSTIFIVELGVNFTNILRAAFEP